MENTNDEKLNFGQRNWLLLCIIVAILSPVVVHWIQAGAHRESRRESMEQTEVKGGTGGMTPSGGAVAPGDTARPGGVNSMQPANNNEIKDTSNKGKDTTYKVAAPPQHK